MSHPAKIFLSVALLLSAAAVAWLFRAHRTSEARRCFVLIEGGTEPELYDLMARTRSAGAKCPDPAALRAALAEFGSVSVEEFPTHSVIRVTAGRAKAASLERHIRIDSFTGSPAALLARVAKESGVDVGTRRWYAGSIIRLIDTDAATRITVRSFRGTIRQLLAATIPASYSTLALSVRCGEDGRIEVFHLGQNQFEGDQFAMDRGGKTLPVPDLLTRDEQEAERPLVRPSLPELEGKHLGKLPRFTTDEGR